MRLCLSHLTQHYLLCGEENRRIHIKCTICAIVAYAIWLILKLNIIWQGNVELVGLAENTGGLKLRIQNIRIFRQFDVFV